MKRLNTMAVLIFGACMVLHNSAYSAVSQDEANQLKTTLTPFGAEKSGNKDGSIPAWEGGYTKPQDGFKQGGKRADPFANEKPLFSINAKNYGQYTDKLNDGQIALFKKYPDYRIDVYQTHRTAAAPQWVYDNTFKNASRAITTHDGNSVDKAYGGIPFPIPKTGAEAIWNHRLQWTGEELHWDFHTVITTSDDQRVLVSDSIVDNNYPYYEKNGSLESFKGEFNLLRLTTNGPPQKAGEALLIRDPTDQIGKQRLSWQYLTGQRRVRKIPNVNYDTPSFVTSGVSNFDEVNLWYGPMDRYDWKLVGKKELYIPYNTNKIYGPTKDADIMGTHFLNPDYVRWELHRVWVVEATLGADKRHVMPKRRFYLDEDTWNASLEDGWDAKGDIWKTLFYLNVVAPDLPGVIQGIFGHYNLQTGDWIANNVMNEKTSQIECLPLKPDTFFTPDALASESVR